MIKKRLISKQYLIIARGAAKSMYASFLQSYFLNIDTSTTYQIATAPTMKQAEEVVSPIKTSITRARGPLFKFLTEGSMWMPFISRLRIMLTLFMLVSEMQMSTLSTLKMKCSAMKDSMKARTL